MSARRSAPRRGRPRRGDGVPKLPPPGELLKPVRPEEAPEPRRVLDLSGPLWRWVLLLGAIGLLLALVGPSLGAALLVLENRPVGPYLEAMKDWILNVVIGSAALLFAAIARRQGTTQRSQKTTSDNVFATAARVDLIAKHVSKQEERLAEAVTGLSEVKAAVEGLKVAAGDSAAASRVNAAVGRLEQLLDVAGRTGPLAVVTAAVYAAPEPPYAPSVPYEPEAYAEDEDGAEDDSVDRHGVLLADYDRTERHADTLPPLRPLPAPSTTAGTLRPLTGPIRPTLGVAGGVVEGDVVDVEVLDPRLRDEPREEPAELNVWGPAGRPAWVTTGENPAAAETRTDALAALLGPRRRDTPRPETWSEILAAVDKLDRREPRTD